VLWSATAPPAALTADLVGALDTYWQFEDAGSLTLSDISGSTAAHPGSLTGLAGVSPFGAFGSAGYFHGGEASITNHADFNLSTMGQRTIAMWFYAEDVDAPGRQMLFEEGAGTRGLNIYLEDGRLYVGGWNRAESNWSGTWLSTDAVQSGRWHHVTLVLDGGATVTDGAFHGYLDGVRFGSGEGSQLWPHSGDINVGNGGDTRYPDGTGSAADPFTGYIDEFRAYSRALSDHDIAVLGGAFNERAAVENTQPPRDLVAVFFSGTSPLASSALAEATPSDTEGDDTEASWIDRWARSATPEAPGQHRYATPGTDGTAEPTCEPQEAGGGSEQAAERPTGDRDADPAASSAGTGGQLPSPEAGTIGTDELDPSQVAEVETEGKARVDTRDKQDHPAESPHKKPAPAAPSPNAADPRVDALRLGAAVAGFALPMGSAETRRR
jgi:hypothetical protein